MAEFEERPRLSIGEEEAPPYPLEKLTGGRRRTRAQIHALHQQAGRVPPQAVELEQAVLGAMLIEPEAIPRALEILTPEAFYDGRHQRIFRAIIRLFEQNRGVDLLTVTEELRRTGELEQAGDTIYLSELTTRVASAANVEYHARIIAEKALLRRMIEVMTLLIGRAYDPAADAFELLDEVEAEIFRLSDVHLRKAARSMNEVVKETLERLEAIHGRPGGITGVPSGFHQLDALTGGWQRGDLVIIAARPSMGKTAFALSCARNAALHPHYGTGVAIFSLEMGAEQLAQRLLTAEARVDAQAARTGRLRDEDWRKLARAAGRLSDAPIFIDDTPSLGVLELRAKCRRLKAEHDIGLVIVDYLQLMQASHMPRNANREQEIAQISRSLKALAKELNVPVVALSQLSRAVETRGGDKRPQLSDLRESGCLAGDTLITLADGRRVPIRELVGQQNFSVWALNPQTYRLERARVSRAFCTGIKPVYRLTTQLGRSIRATANHRFLTPQGWKRVDELQPGDYLALPRRIPTASTSTLTEAELALLGHLIGDGSTLPSHAIRCAPALLPHLELAAPVGTDFRSATVYQHLSRALALRPDEAATCPELRQPAESDVYWDPIVSIEPDGVEEVFDLTVPGPHNFVANDIIAHNSIEQDADVVLFIYRPERYGITVDENGNPTEGIAEIIIGKQRNGPTGTVRLAFINQYARFENLTMYQPEPGTPLPETPDETILPSGPPDEAPF